MSESILVGEEYGGSRADAGLAGLLGISRSLAASLIAEGHVTNRGNALGTSARLVAPATLASAASRSMAASLKPKFHTRRRKR